MILFWLRRPLASLIRTKFGHSWERKVDYALNQDLVTQVQLHCLQPIFDKPVWKFNMDWKALSLTGKKSWLPFRFHVFFMHITMFFNNKEFEKILAIKILHIYYYILEIMKSKVHFYSARLKNIFVQFFFLKATFIEFTRKACFKPPLSAIFSPCVSLPSMPKFISSKV